MKINSKIDIYQGDCRELLPRIIESVDNPVIVTDPPFNIGYKYESFNDNVDEDEYFDYLSDLFILCPAVIIHYPEKLYRLAHEIFLKGGSFPERIVSWVYNSNTQRQHRDVAFFGVKPDFSKVRQPYKNQNDKRIQKLISSGKTGAKLYDWWNVNQVKNVNKEKTKHPCQMPVKVMDNIVGILPEGVTVIDPFMGSGTTAIPCIDRGMSFIGIEIEQSYYEVSVNRLTEYVKEPVQEKLDI